MLVQLINFASAYANTNVASFAFAIVKYLQDPNYYAFQSDSIEGWVQSQTHSSINVTATSAYSTILQRHVPVLLSIMFGRSADHYAAHFRTLLNGIGYTDYTDFQEKFPGNISDFSLAEKAGWELAIRSIYNIGPKVEDIELEKTYKCCRVHFSNSCMRVKKSHRLVPRHKLEVFDGMIKTLLSKDINDDTFYETIQAFRNNFSGITVMPKRAVHHLLLLLDQKN